jgi:hypothetical protein
MTGALATLNTEIDGNAVLQVLGLNPRDPNAQALLLVCQQYRLDPVLKHMVLIKGRPYITRDGYLHVAHASGLLDGVEVLDEGEEPGYWWARVAVYRKDMSRPFIYKGRYPKQGAGNKEYGPEMAIKCAEVAALRRAFDVTGVGAVDEKWDADDAVPVRADVIEARTVDAGLADARAQLVARLNAVADAEERTQLKRTVVNEWGRPDTLTAEQVTHAHEWLDEQLAEPDTAEVVEDSLGEDPATATPDSPAGTPRPAGHTNSTQLSRQLAQAGLKTSVQRHAFITVVTGGNYTTTTALAAADQRWQDLALDAAHDLFYGRTILDQRFDGTAAIVRADTSEPVAYIEGETAKDAVPLDPATWWELQLVGVHGIGPAKLLKTAQAICRQKGLAEPADLGSVPDDRDVRVQLLEWLAQHTTEGGAA